MVESFPIEVSMGMELYSTESSGIGGKLKHRYEDFRVEEITPEGDPLSLWEVEDSSPVTSDVTISGERARHIKITLQKMGLSTLDVANILSAELKVSRNLVSYAGLKDKRAITVQAMTIPAKASELLGSIKLSNIWIRNPHYVKQRIQIGDLWGNQFTILLRDLNVDCKDAVDTCREIRKTPILNYFGVQRFGVVRPYTHLAGRCLVKRDFEGAVRIMLTKESEFESDELTSARRRLAEDISADVLENFPPDLSYERTILKYLSNHPGKYKEAFHKIPPRIQALFVHSYQSYLFNRLISSRIRDGLSISVPHPGDFLIQLNTTHSGRDSWVFASSRNIDEKKELVNSGQYGLAAPLPGYSTKTPPSRQTDLLNDLLENEDVILRDFRNQKNKDLDSPGGLHLVSIQLPSLSAECVDEGLLLRFNLRKGSYATVVMRELMKNHPINRV
ncbi:MAG: tRNA pseudouridine(13) synthase TruD [Candidatus Thorarchaeota archaeon]